MGRPSTSPPSSSRAPSSTPRTTCRAAWRTCAQFVSTLGPDIAHVFVAVLSVCDQQGLIGRETSPIERHRANDTADVEPTLAAKTQQRHKRRTRDASQLRE